MLAQTRGQVAEVSDLDSDAQDLIVLAAGSRRRAVNYRTLTGDAGIGDEVLLNITGVALKLGTGGVDFVMANLSRTPEFAGGNDGHIIKARYLPCQHSVLTLEEQARYADIWERGLDEFPVLVGQLHSQVIPTACGLLEQGKRRIAYVMTDAAALPLAFSKTIRAARAQGVIATTITCGQAFGGDYETVTPHSALLAAKHIADADAVIVCQGPGNAGTGTRYGFSGVEQAGILDIAARLGGTPIAIARMSAGDARPRHQGVSHHTRTTLDLTYARCVVPIPIGHDGAGIPDRHNVKYVEGYDAALARLRATGISVTTMGRDLDQDPLFFAAAACAGLAA
ncbi:hypothetical protein CCAX7_43560 [Capsulimonas corticalis]|uniref:Uncharacterized protein n=1 Tax=Capsulimonas corticalis TaxID=2219043 RepID=A0A402CXJ8_9BACT|nr:DUF3866 family protein [Capsulimonas corticalis]BDI32305.1 hypothetical protein CCAX7_43560 [Capsulimonas corticalis]